MAQGGTFAERGTEQRQRRPLHVVAADQQVGVEAHA
jgi:hypothetical protein